MVVKLAPPVDNSRLEQLGNNGDHSRTADPSGVGVADGDNHRIKGVRMDMDIFDGNETDEATFENYVRITEWSNFSPEDRKEYTSKKFEKSIYDDYKTRENSRIQRLIDDSRELKRNLEIEISDVRDRQDYLRHHYNL